MTDRPDREEEAGGSADRPRRRGYGAWVAGALAVGLCVLHGAGIWLGLGGWSGLTGPWPMTTDDHLHYFHNAAITPAFLRASGTTAGYDPSFMAGYPKSFYSVNSSTLPELVLFVAGKDHQVLAYKVYVFASAALLPWIVAGAGLVARARSDAVAAAVALFLTYVWTDFPIAYAQMGMLPYLLAVPLALLATALLARYVERGGSGLWLAATAASALAVMVHVTTVTIRSCRPSRHGLFGGDPRGATGRGAAPASRHMGLLSIASTVLLVNAFWWVPGVWLASAKGPSDFVFSHPEPVLGRLWELVFREVEIQAVLVAGGLVGLAAIARRDRVMAAAIGGFAAARFFWGYLAGGSRALDFLQPGRHTYAFYTSASLLAGLGFSEVRARLRRGKTRLDAWVTAGALPVAVRLFGPPLADRVRLTLGGPEPFLTSRPPARLLWLVDRLKAHEARGERLLCGERRGRPAGRP